MAVTGGARGLGRALVEAFAGQGADVAFSHHQGGAHGSRLAQALRRRGRRVYDQVADACATGQMAAFVEGAVESLGRLDVLVNNAGVFRQTPVGRITEGVLDEAFDVNVKAAIMTSQAAAPHLTRSGGAIVNVVSLGGLRPWPSHVAYCASKAALVMATRCLALALAPEVRVNGVAPGILDPPGAPDELRRRVPQGRFGRHAEAVEAVMFLAVGAGYTTGEVLSVDGGRNLS